MNNIDFLKQIITTEHPYWLVARESWISEYGSRKRLPDEAWFICIPLSIRRGVAPKDILLSEVEKLNYMETQNIALSEPYSPFQTGITFCNLTQGYPILKDSKDFLIKALAFEGKDFWSYKKLLDQHHKLLEPEPQVV